MTQILSHHTLSSHNLSSPSSGHHPMEPINLTTPVAVRTSRDRGFSSNNHGGERGGGGGGGGGGGNGNGTMSLGGYIDVNHTPAHTPIVIDSATLDAAISAFGAVTISSHGLTSPSGWWWSFLPFSYLSIAYFSPCSLTHTYAPPTHTRTPTHPPHAHTRTHAPTAGVTGLASELSPDVDDAKERNKENAPYKPSHHHPNQHGKYPLSPVTFEIE